MTLFKIPSNPTLEGWMNGIVQLGRHTELNSTARFFINFISNSIVINHIQLYRIEYSAAKNILIYDFFSPDKIRNSNHLQSLLNTENINFKPHIMVNPDQSTTLIIAPICTLEKQQLLLEINLDDYHSEQFTYLPFLIQAFVNQINLVDLNARDSLTGLFNQRVYNEKIEQYVSLYDSANNRREGCTSHCLAIADVDAFKSINDKYGHLFGDDVLIHIAKLLKESFRNRDMVFRYSGEKFTIIINEVSMEIAEKILNRFRCQIEQYEFPLDLKLTISIGYTQLLGSTPDVIFEQAEKALYYAKENGRNQICLFEQLMQQGLLNKALDDDSNIDFF